MNNTSTCTLHQNCIDDYNKITLINNRKDINKNYNCTSQFTAIFLNIKLKLPRHQVQSRLAIMRIGYNAVGRGPRISAARGEMGTTANNNAVINCHIFL